MMSENRRSRVDRKIESHWIRADTDPENGTVLLPKSMFAKSQKALQEWIIDIETFQKQMFRSTFRAVSNFSISPFNFASARCLSDQSTHPKSEHRMKEVYTNRFNSGPNTWYVNVMKHPEYNNLLWTIAKISPNTRQLNLYFDQQGAKMMLEKLQELQKILDFNPEFLKGEVDEEGYSYRSSWASGGYAKNLGEVKMEMELKVEPPNDYKKFTLILLVAKNLNAGRSSAIAIHQNTLPTLIQNIENGLKVNA